MFSDFFNQGYAKAQYDLESMYGSGKGVDKDDAEAINWKRISVLNRFLLGSSVSGLYRV